MKKIHKIILGTLFVFFATACERDFLDVNTDPNATTEAIPGALMTEAMLGYSQNNLNTLNPDGQAYIQYHKPVVVLTGPDTYIVAPIGNNNFWNAVYSGILTNVRLPEIEAAEAGNNNVVAQLKIFQAMVYLTAADRWGEIPFTEANDVENLNPSFDEPTVIYNGIIALIDEALALVDLTNQQEPFTIVNSDPLFNGDMERWQRFANSLKLRVLMRISSVEDVSAQISALLTSGVPFVEDNSQNVEFRYFADRTNQNFDFATFDNFTNLNSYQLDGGIRRHQRWRRGANGLVDLLNTLGDPRRFSYFDRDLSFETTPPPADPETPVDFFDRTAPLVGSPNGASAQPDPEDRCYTSLFFIRQDKSDEWLTAAEHNLLAAEAYARGLAPGGLTAAQTAMEAGIRASMTQFDGFTYEGKNYEIPDEEIDDYIDALPELTTLTADEALEVIQEQQYIALFNNGQEAWSNWRRTKVPDLQVPIGAPIITVISRIELPNDELRANSNAPSVTPRIDEPVYFEKPRQ